MNRDYIIKNGLVFCECAKDITKLKDCVQCIHYNKRYVLDKKEEFCKYKK